MILRLPLILSALLLAAMAPVSTAVAETIPAPQWPIHWNEANPPSVLEHNEDLGMGSALVTEGNQNTYWVYLYKPNAARFVALSDGNDFTGDVYTYAHFEDKNVEQGVIYAGNSDANITGNVHFYADSGTFSTIYGGSRAGAKDTRIDGGTYITFTGDASIPTEQVAQTSAIYGGGYAAKDRTNIVTGGSHIQISGNTSFLSSSSVFGGGYTDTEGGTVLVEGGSHIVIDGKADFTSKISGGGWAWNYGTALVTGGTHITIKDGGTAGEIYGGGRTSGTPNQGISRVDSAEINMTGGEVGNVIGGGEANWFGRCEVTGGVVINISGGTISSNLAGGGEVNGDSTVKLLGHSIVSGGVVINISEKTNISTSLHDVYGGGILLGQGVAATVEGGSTLNIEGGTINSIHGGGALYATAANISTHDYQLLVSVDKSTINLKGGQVTGNVYGGGEFVFLENYSENTTAKNIVGSVIINIEGGHVEGSVYAGGEGAGAIVTGDSSLNISGGTIDGNIYAGGAEDSTVKGTSTITITGGTLASHCILDGSGAGKSILNWGDNNSAYTGTLTASRNFNETYITGSSSLTITGSMETGLLDVDRSTLKLDNAALTTSAIKNSLQWVYIKEGSSLILEGNGAVWNHNYHAAIKEGATFSLLEGADANLDYLVFGGKGTLRGTESDESILALGLNKGGRGLVDSAFGGTPGSDTTLDVNEHAKLTASQGLAIGHRLERDAVLNINEGGQLEVNTNALRVGAGRTLNGDGTAGNGTLNISGGSVATEELIIGSLDAKSGSTQYGTGRVSLKGQSLLAVSGNTDIGAGGSLFLESGASAQFSGNMTMASGAVFHNRGILALSGELTLNAGATLYTGLTTSLDKGLTLTSSSTGLEQVSTLTIHEGATLGINVVNTSGEQWSIFRDDLYKAATDIFAPVVGDKEIHFGYYLEGNICVTDMVITPGESVVIGNDATVTFEGNLPEHGVHISGGNADVSQLADGALSDNHIKGDGGTLVTRQDQTLTLTQGQTVGYSLTGVNGESGAAIIIDIPSHSGTQNVTLTGSYSSDKIDINNGIVENKGGILGSGSDGSILTVAASSSDQAVPTLINNGTIRNEVVMNDGSQIKGTGVFEKKVTLAGNNTLTIGNSPGYIDYQGGLTVGAGSRVIFDLDGTTGATLSHNGNGTYSNISVSGHFDWSQRATLVLNLGIGIIDTTQDNLSFDLIHFAPEVDTTIFQSQLEDGTFQSELTGQTNLFSGGPEFTLENGIFSVKGKLNTGILEPEGARLSNALWSSTRAVGDFAQTASAQLDAPRNGNSNFWVAGLGGFSRMDDSKGISGYDYNGGGYAIGADQSFMNKRLTTGLAFGQSFGQNKSNDSFSSIDQDGIMAGIYARHQTKMNDTNSLFLDGNFAYGRVSNKSNSHFANNMETPSHAKWDDNIFSAGVKASWSIKLNEHHTLTPHIGMDYINGSQDNINQTSSMAKQNYGGADLSQWTLPVGITWQGVWQTGEDQYIIPEVTVAYENDIVRDSPYVRTVLGGKSIDLYGSNPGRNALKANSTIRYILNKSWSAAAAYNLEYRTGMTNHAVNASLNYSF